jgi:cytochrome P450
VRINPYELHIKDAEYYDVVYAGGKAKRDKWHWSAKMFGNSDSMLGTLPHSHHRLRRAALNPYFSKQSVANLEPTIKGVVEKLCNRFEQAKASGEPINLGYAYAALAMDVITEYSFSKSYGCVDDPGFAHQWPDIVDGISRQSHINQQFGWLLPAMKMLPLWMVKATNPDMMQLIYFQDVRAPSLSLSPQLTTLQDMEKSISKIIDGRTDTKQSSNPTIFHELLNSDLPAEEKTLTRLRDEGQTVVAAGQVTTAHHLKTMSYHILANPSILSKLQAELKQAMPDPSVLAPQSKLENLPYFRAVVLEGFRKSYGVVHRLQRISPDQQLQYKDWVIPAGTPVGMTSVFMHDDPERFPEPEKFKPERWLNGGERMEKYLVNFSKGSRQCMGMNLAYAEIYLTLAAVFRRFELELFETTQEDAEVKHDYFNPQPAIDSKGIRVVVK